MLSGVLGPGQAAWNSLSDIIKLTADINRFKNFKKISIPPCILTSRLCPWTICKLHFIKKLFVFVQCQLREESYHTGPRQLLCHCRWCLCGLHKSTLSSQRAYTQSSYKIT